MTSVPPPPEPHDDLPLGTHDDAEDGPWELGSIRNDLIRLRELFVELDPQTGRLTGWSDSKFARRAGLSQQYVQLIMTGQSRNPGADKLADIVRAFDGLVPPSYFFSAAVRKRVDARLQARKWRMEREYLNRDPGE